MDMAKVHATYSKKDGSVLSYSTVAFIGTHDDGKPYQKKLTIKVSDLPPGTPTTPKKQLAAAEKELDEVIEEMRDEFKRTHRAIDRNQITLQQFVTEHWFPDSVLNGKKSPNTIAFYKDQSAKVLEYFKGVKLSAIDNEAIIRFNNYQRSEAKKDNGEPISQSTAAHRYSTLRAILGYAYRTHYIKENPISFLEEDDKITQEKHDVFYLKEDEIEAFMKMLRTYSEESKSQSKYWELYFTIALNCGLRRGEIIPLQWKDIILSDGGMPSILIEKNAVRDPSSPDKMAIRKPKNHKTRYVPIPPATYTLLNEYRSEQEQNGISTLPACYIFPRSTDPSRPMYPTSPTKRLRTLEEKYNVATASVHDLRHTTGSTMSRKGMPLKVIQALLGHSSIAVTTGYYVGTDDEQMRLAVNSMDYTAQK